MFKFEKRKRKLRKRYPRIFTRGPNKFVIKNVDKAIVLPAETPNEAFKLLTDRNIYTKANRKPSSKARDEMLKSVSDEKLKSTLDNFIKLKLIEQIKKLPDSRLNNTEPIKQPTTPDVLDVLDKTTDSEILSKAKLMAEVKLIRMDDSLESEEKREREEYITRSYLQYHNPGELKEYDETDINEQLKERFKKDKEASDAALAADAALATQEYNKNLEDLAKGKEEVDIPKIENEAVELVQSAEALGSAVQSAVDLQTGTDTQPLLEPRADNLEIPVETKPIIPKPPNKSVETKRRKKEEREKQEEANSEYLFMTPEQQKEYKKERAKIINERLKRYSIILNRKVGRGKLDETGMSDRQIDEIMEGQDKYIGTIPRDEILKLIPLARHALDRFGEFGFIMNIDTRKQERYEHWVAVYCDVNERKELCYYDPFGENPPFEKIVTDLKIMVKKLEIPFLLKFKINHVVNQDMNSSRCGIFSMMFLEKMFSGWSFKEATDYKKQNEKSARKVEDKLDKFGLI